ncbi:MAG: Rrf2 family transcriptional regulator [Tissierellia bacterium]|nr:Rrf2 family transcriptional regulator [Tissierellia bacterium]
MKLSTKGRYGLLAMYRLRESHGDGPLPLNRIAEDENLSEAYLEQLFASLKKAELINSIRGAQGGYVLARDPADIKIGDILRALEGDIELSCCPDDSDEVNETCIKGNDCAMKNILDKIKASFDEVVDSISLADM